MEHTLAALALAVQGVPIDYPRLTSRIPLTLSRRRLAGMKRRLTQRAHPPATIRCRARAHGSTDSIELTTEEGTSC